MPVNNEKVNEDRKKLVDAVIQEMEKGTPFFWDSGHFGSLNRPRNLMNNIKGKDKPYKGINAMTLMYYGMKKGYKDARWCTFYQADELGFKIKKGAEGVPIEYWEFKGPKKEKNPKTGKWETVYEVDENGKKKPVIVKYKKPLVRRYVVFNAEQMEGVPPLEKPLAMTNEERNIYFENMINNSEAPIYFDQASKNFYVPSSDEIHVMPREQFKDMDYFYGTVAHEIAHSTGAASRNNRPGITEFAGFGSETYAKEELVAEMSAMFLNSEYGLTADAIHMDNHKAYLRSWVKALREDPDELFRAASMAEQAVDYIKERMIMKDLDKIKDPSFKIVSYDTSIREYYQGAFPDDELGERITDISFKQLYKELKAHKDVYDLVGVGDSLVRERLFNKLAEISGKDYSEIYLLCLGEEKQEKDSAKEKAKKPKTVDKKKLAEKVTDAWGKENLPTEGLPDSIIEKPKLPTSDIAELGEWYDCLRTSYMASTPKEEVDVEVIRHMMEHGLKENRINMIYKNNASKYPGYPSQKKLGEILKSPEIREHSSMTSFKEELNSLIDEHIKNTNKQLARASSVGM